VTHWLSVHGLAAWAAVLLQKQRSFIIGLYGSGKNPYGKNLRSFIVAALKLCKTCIAMKFIDDDDDDDDDVGLYCTVKNP